MEQIKKYCGGLKLALWHFNHIFHFELPVQQTKFSLWLNAVLTSGSIFVLLKAENQRLYFKRRQSSLQPTYYYQIFKVLLYHHLIGRPQTILRTLFQPLGDRGKGLIFRYWNRLKIILEFSLSVLARTDGFFQSQALIARQSFPGPLAVLVWVCVLGWLAFVPGLDKVSMCWLFISGEGRVKKNVLKTNQLVKVWQQQEAGGAG